MEREIIEGKEWQCTDCKYFGVEVTGRDEYPPCTAIAYCKKGHWENGDPNGAFPVDGCPDFETDLSTK